MADSPSCSRTSSIPAAANLEVSRFQIEVQSPEEAPLGFGEQGVALGFPVCLEFPERWGCHPDLVF